MSEQNAELVRRLFDAFNDLDADAMLEMWTPDCEWRPAFTGGGLLEGAVYRGHAGIADYLAMQRETWESIVVASRETIADLGDRILIEVQLNAIGKASGVPVEVITWSYFELRDGRVAVARVYTTKAEALEAIGLEE